VNSETPCGHPERPPPAPKLTGMARLIDAWDRHQGLVFAVAAGAVIVLTLIYGL
jgi:hypothetical protein